MYNNYIMNTKETLSREVRPSLGRLKALGPQQFDQLAFLVPRDYEDIALPVVDFATLVTHAIGTEILTVEGRLFQTPVKHWGKIPSLTLMLVDDRGYSLNVCIFGNTQSLQRTLNPGKRYCFRGKLTCFQQTLQLSGGEWIPEEWIGRVRPRYPGKSGYLNAETVARKMTEYLPLAIPLACAFLRRQLRIKNPLQEQQRLHRYAIAFSTLEAVFHAVHTPETRDQGIRARHALLVLSAHYRVAQIGQQSSPAPANCRPNVMQLPALMAQLPFTLTGEQQQIVRELYHRMNQPNALRHMLMGDTGSGKTVCYAMAVAGIIEAGGFCAIILPSTSLARQIAADFQQWFPAMPVQLVVAGEKYQWPQNPSAPAEVHIGTTALLHNNPCRYALVVVDEQHKLGTKQRQQLLTQTHLLEVTASPIPRSTALLKLGVMSVSLIRHCHVQRSITTRLYEASARQTLFQKIIETVNRQEKVLILYPQIGESEAENKKALASAAGHWENHFPGQVCQAHGHLTEKEKQTAIETFKQNQASILIATTVVECGMNIPGLTLIVVINPEKFGLSTLYQVRGRLCREGGSGECCLFADKPLAEKTRARLQALIDARNGDQLAQAELQLRGAGQLQEGVEQSGHHDCLVYGFSDQLALEAILHQKI